MKTFAPAVAPLVGRDAELRVLQTVVTRVLDNEAQVVALSGQAGVGKSRLAQECLAAARSCGFLTLQGVGGALQRDVTYAPLVEALRPLVHQKARPGRPALVDGLLDLGRLFGDLSLPPGPELGDPGLERTRLFESVCRLLERASARQPLALLLDDVHWADRGSLALLHYLIRGLVTRPLLVVLTYRDDEADPALRDLLAGLRRAGSFAELRLAGLTDQAVGMHARDLLGGDAPAGLLDVLTARSGGVPLFVGALVESFVDSGALYRYDGRWALAPQQPEAIPAVVSALLESQIQRLPHEARQVLDLLAVCGAQVDHPLLERLMPGDRVLCGLADLRAAGLVVEEVADGRIRYRAAHALLCEVAYDLLPLVVRRRRHAEVARAVEQYAPAQRGLLAQHVRRAGDEIDPGHALDVLLGAAGQALACKAGDEALADVRAALDLVEAADRRDVLPGLLDCLGEAYELAGYQEEAVSAWLAAAAQHTKGIALPHASYAGLYTTVLNVRGEAALRDAVSRCWASARAPRVTAYAGDGAAPGLAVLVQPMVPAVAAGVAFTVDPVAGDRDVVVIDAVRGLAEQLVSGAVTPDRWEVRTEARRLPGPLSATPAVDATTACAIAALARRIEQVLGTPQDVEWALAGDGTLVLLQARPVTTLHDKPVQLIPLAVEPPEGFWVRETSHAPLPWTAFTHAVFEARNRGIRHMCAELGLLIETVEFHNIGGWEYLRIVPLGGKKPPPLPAWAASLAFRIVPALRRRIRRSVAAIRSDVPGALIRRWAQHWQPDLAARIAALRDVDLAGLDDAALDEHLRDVLALTEHGQIIHFRLHGAIAMVLGELAFTCRDLLGWDEAKVVELLAGTSQMSTAPARALAAITAIARERPAVRRLIEDGAPAETVLAADERFAAAFDAYQREYGCRVLRYEIAEPCLDEQPDLVLALIRDQLVTGFDPDAAEQALRAQRAAARAAAVRLLAKHSPAEHDRFDRALDRALAAYPVREDNEFFTTSIPFALLRRAAREIGRRLTARGLLTDSDDAFCLKPPQLRTALRENFDCRALVTTRAGERAWALAHPGPASYGRPPGPPPSLSALPAEARLANEAFLWAVEQNLGPHAVDVDHGVPAATDATVLSGIPVSAGSYTGPVRIIRSESEFGRLRPGDVLVCPVTSPVWSVLFPSIGALVTDIGGMLSHPAIIAREYRLPAVVATGDGTSRLTNGQIVTVDGTAGIVWAAR